VPAAPARSRPELAANRRCKRGRYLGSGKIHQLKAMPNKPAEQCSGTLASACEGSWRGDTGGARK